jgi:hypothetical protein
MLPLRIVLLCSGFSYGADCITLTTDVEICGKLQMASPNYWVKNRMNVNDTLTLDFEKINRIAYEGKLFVRVSPGNMLSDFAMLTKGDKLKMYENKGAVQFGNQTFYNGKSKYFSLDGNRLYYFNLANLKNELPVNSLSQPYLNRATTKKWISFGIRLASLVPFYIGINQAAGNHDSGYLLPLGIGIAMIAVPSFTFTPSIKKDISLAVEEFNKGD